jgi:hypothetical protein
MALRAGTEQKPQVQAPYSEQSHIKGQGQRAPALDTIELTRNWRAPRAVMSESRTTEQCRVRAKARRAKNAMFSESKTSEKAMRAGGVPGPRA